MMWKEAFVAYLRYYSCSCLEGLRKTHKASVRIAFRTWNIIKNIGALINLSG
jgi:hypothetical protein